MNQHDIKFREVMLDYQPNRQIPFTAASKNDNRFAVYNTVKNNENPPVSDMLYLSPNFSYTDLQTECPYGPLIAIRKGGPENKSAIGVL